MFCVFARGGASLSPLHGEDAAHGRRGRGRGRVLDHAGGGAVRRRGRGGDGQADGHAPFLRLSWRTTSTASPRSSENSPPSTRQQGAPSGPAGLGTAHSPVGDWLDSIRPTLTTCNEDTARGGSQSTVASPGSSGLRCNMGSEVLPR